MQKRLFIAVFSILAMGYPAQAATAASRTQPGMLELGLILGSPTGPSLKYWTGGNGAIDAAIGFPFQSDVNFDVHSDYLWHVPLPVNVPGQLPFYLGLGGRLRSIDRNNESQKVDFGLRMPLGLEFLPNNLPLGFFAEIAPVLVFTPKGDLDLDGGVGVRYRF